MVNICKLELSLLQQRILSHLFIHAGMAFTAHALANGLNVSQPGIAKALPALEKKALITVQKDRQSGRLAIEMNRDSIEVVRFKRAHNLMQVYESGLARFLEDSFPGAAIILFGSYSRGDDTATSDIDIAVIGRKEKALDFSSYEKALARKIIVNYYDNLPAVHKALRENICNGIVLAGGISL